MCKAGSELGAFGKEKIDLIGSDTYSVTLFVRDSGGSSSYDADSVSRNKDVGIGGLAAPVENHSVNPVRKNQKGSLGWEHTYVHSCHKGYVMSPDASGIDGYDCIIV